MTNTTRRTLLSAGTLALPLAMISTASSASATARSTPPTRKTISSLTLPHVVLPHAVLGACFHGTWNYQNNTQRNRALATFAAAGGSWIRQDMRWSDVETSPGHYAPGVLASYDNVIALAATKHLSVLLVIHESPSWATPDGNPLSPPSDPAAMGRFVAAMSRRYAGRVQAIEVWNEANSTDFFAPRNSSASREYFQLLQAVYAEVKSNGARGTLVMGAGTSYVDDTWWRQLYALGVARCTDAVTVHPYMSPSDLPPTTPDDGGIWTINHLGVLLNVMRSYNDAQRPIWLTELGWSTHSNVVGAQNWERGVSAATQAVYATTTVNLLQSHYPQVAATFWYNLRDRTDDTLQNDHYGLLTTDLTSKPIVAALARSYAKHR